MLMIIRTLLAALFFFGGSFVVLFVSLVRPFQPKVALLFTTIFAPLSVKGLGVKMIVRRKEIMYQTHPAIYIANHQNALDLPIHASMVCMPTVAIGKKEIRRVPFFGWLYWLTGQILIDRHHHRSAMETMSYAAQIAKKMNVAVWLFPEGTRSGDKPMQKFKKGAFYLAIQSQLPLIPIVASTYRKTVNLNRWKAGTIIVEVMDPVPTLGKTIEDVDSLIEHCHKLMSDKIAQLDKELAT
jgi:1-acyl-sn-glycerol-3-phosphate acyltransferase